MAPVWEANHVWLIFVLVVCWTAYPTAFGSIASTLAVPLFVAAVGIILRGTAYALRSGAPSDRETESVIGFVFSLSSILTPFALGAAVGAIASGRVPVGNAEGDLVASWLNPTSLLIGALAVATAAYLAAVYLAGDAARAGAAQLSAGLPRPRAGAGRGGGRDRRRRPRRAARGRTRAVRRPDRAEPGWPPCCVSALAGPGDARRSCALGRYEPARFSAALAVAAIVAGWGIAQSPDLLPGLTIEDAAAGRSTLWALLISIAAGLVILLPSLVLLYGLVLRGRFDVGAAAGPEPPQPRAARGARGLAAGAGTLFVVGTVLTLFADDIGLAIGVLSLVGYIVLGAIELLGPEKLTDE